MNNFIIEDNKFDKNEFKKFRISLLGRNNNAISLNHYSEYDLVDLLHPNTSSEEGINNEYEIENKEKDEYKTENKRNDFIDESKKEEFIFNLFKSKEEEKILIEKEYKYLVKYIKLSSIDNGTYNNLIEEKIMDIYEIQGDQFLAEILQKISLDYFNQPKMLSVICDCLHVFDLEEVYPWGPVLLTSYVSNKDEELKSDAVYLISSWSDKSLIPLLKGIDCKSKWLQDYVDEVIEKLEN